MASLVSSSKPLRIGIVAGEASGDLLGSELIAVLKKKHPDAIIEGVAGPKMIREGCQALFPMESLAVMGFIDPLKRLPEILKIRAQLRQHFLSNPPDVFIGIDAPDFNLGLEVVLKRAGIPVVHYVSPTVWAWRKRRIYKIERAVDLMLTLFPFETQIYEKHHIPVEFVGHPLADKIPFQPNQIEYRKALDLPLDSKILAMLPGSRGMELKHLAEVFIRTAQWCLEREPNLQIIVPMVSFARQRQFNEILQKIAPALPVRVFMNQSRAVIGAADSVLLASGTATLETMLLKKPMVVAYRLGAFNYALARLLVKLNYFSLPNLIADKVIVPEFLQSEVRPEVLGPVVLKQLTDADHISSIKSDYTNLHILLRQKASHKAADAILNLIESKQKNA